jgi:predicted dehydrogenase
VTFLLRKIKVAIVGTGQIATKARIPAYKSNRNVELVAFVDINTARTKRVARKFNVKNVYSSIDELLSEQDVDVVSICTPPNTHADLAIKALNYGAQVLVEKPMADSLEKGKKMFEVSKARQRILWVSSYRRFVPNFRRAREQILKGKLGHVYCVEDIQLTPSPLLTWGKSLWYYQPGSGGVLLDFGPHCFDLFNYLLGDFPEAVSVVGSTHLDSPVEEVCVCVLEYPENRIGVGTMSWLSSTVIENTSIHGTVETMFVSPKFLFKINRADIPEVSLWRDASLRLINLKFPSFPILPMQKNIDPLQLETDCFIEQIKTNHISFSNAINALNVLATCEAAKKALHDSRRTEISLQKGEEN